MMRRLGRIAVLLLLLIAVSGFVLTSVTVVGPGQALVVRRLGKLLTRPTTEGIYVGLPFGLETRESVHVDQVRQLVVAGDDEYMTADRNVLTVRANVQYRTADAAAFALATNQPIPLLERAARNALIRTLHEERIDAVLREGRERVATAAATRLQKEVDTAHLGVTVLSFNLAEARPPEELAAAFAEAESARSRKSQRGVEARARSEILATQVSADSARLIEKARADAATLRSSAQGEARRFEALLVQVQSNRALTLRQLYYDALATILNRPRRKVVIQSGQPVDLSVFGARP